MMDSQKKAERYGRLYDQISGLLHKSNNMLSNMSTIIAVLHHKMDYFFGQVFIFCRMVGYKLVLIKVLWLVLIFKRIQVCAGLVFKPDRQ